MASKTVQKRWLQDVEKIQKQIQEIYFLNQPDIAQDFEQRLLEIKQKLLNNENNLNENYGLAEQDIDLTNDIISLELDIETFWQEKGNSLKLKQAREQFSEQTKNLTSKADEKTTQELWQGLSDIINEWNQYQHSEVEKEYMSQRVAKAVYTILRSQAKKSEEIDLETMAKYCTEEDLVNIIKNDLIKKAQTQENNQDILDIAKNLTPESLTYPLTWRRITGIDNVTIKQPSKTINQPEEEKIEAENQNAQTKEQRTMALTVVNSKPKLLDRIREKIQKMKGNIGETIFTLADIDKKTGEFKNIRVVRGDFRKGLSGKKNAKVRAIEINGVQLVESSQLLKYENVVQLDFNDVEAIGEHCCGILKKLENVNISDNVVNLEEYALANCYNLKNVEIGNGVTKLGDYCFWNSRFKANKNTR